MHGAEPGLPERPAAALERDSQVIFIGRAKPAGTDGDAAWSGLDRDILEPVRAALLRGRLKSASFLIGSSTFEVDRDARWQFWRRSKPLAEALQ